MADDLTADSSPGKAAAVERSDPPASPPGYELVDEIGRGGMGIVYRVRDTSLDREVAVKLLSERYAADSLAAQRFLGEARITGQLQHPGIPALHQFGTLADGRPLPRNLMNEELLRRRFAIARVCRHRKAFLKPLVP